MLAKYNLFILIFLCFNVSAQTKIDVKEGVKPNVLDTLYYLKTNFEVKKSEFIGKPFSYLLSKMTKIQPKTVWNTPDIRDGSTVEKSLFRFYDMNYPILNETKMLIKWRTGVSYRTVSLYARRNKYYFTNAERKFYGNLIIQDIFIYR